MSDAERFDRDARQEAAHDAALQTAKETKAAPSIPAGILAGNELQNCIAVINKLAGMKNPIAGTAANRIGGLPSKLQGREIAMFVRWCFQFLTLMNMAAQSKLPPDKFAVELDRLFQETKANDKP